MAPEALRRRFPSLSDADLDAYVAVTRRVLAAGPLRARALKEVLSQARAAREQEASGRPLTPELREALGYLSAIEKMQG